MRVLKTFFVLYLLLINSTYSYSSALTDSIISYRRQFASASSTKEKNFINRNLCQRLLQSRLNSEPIEENSRFVSIDENPGFLITKELANDPLVKDLTNQQIIENLKKYSPSLISKHTNALPTDFEWTAGVAFARLFSEHTGEKLALIPSIEDTHIPGFDGVITYPSKKIIQSFTLKNIFGGSVFSALSKALIKGNRFSYLDTWSEIYLKQNLKTLHTKWLASAGTIFKLATKPKQVRRFRVLLYIEPESPLSLEDALTDARDFMKKQSPFSQDIISSIWIIKNSEAGQAQGNGIQNIFYKF